jgi:hypothetical protein
MENYVRSRQRKGKTATEVRQDLEAHGYDRPAAEAFVMMHWESKELDDWGKKRCVHFETSGCCLAQANKKAKRLVVQGAQEDPFGHRRQTREARFAGKTRVIMRTKGGDMFGKKKTDETKKRRWPKVAALLATGAAAASGLIVFASKRSASKWPKDGDPYGDSHFFYFEGVIMEFPKDRDFMYYEDNGDNTVTVTIRFKEFEGTVVFPGELANIIGAALTEDFDFQRHLAEFAPQGVVIPDDKTIEDFSQE